MSYIVEIQEIANGVGIAIDSIVTSYTVEVDSSAGISLGKAGSDGDSAYDVAVNNGFVGTEQEWLDSLVGADGAIGDSAYDVWIAEGNVGNTSDYINAITGESGRDGADGDQGIQGIQGVQGDAGADGIDATPYDDTAIQAEVDLNTAKVSNVDHPLVETAVPVGAVFTDTIYNDSDVLKDADALTAVTPTNKLMTQDDVSGLGGGDMLASTYDPIINANTAKVSNVDHPLVETAVPSGAVFTDTIYDDSDVLKDADTLTPVTAINKIITETDVAALGGGDMLASTYDPIINANTAKVTNVDHPLVETAVPVGAVFTDTDTIYDDTTIQAEVDLNTAKVSFDSTSSTRLANTSGTNTGDQDISGIATNASAISSLQTDSHTHINKVTLDKFGQNAGGLPTYNGLDIDTTIAQRDVYDGLDSLDNTISLSANNGKVLKDVQDNQQTAINLNTAKVSNVNHPLVETAVPVGAVFTDTVYDDSDVLKDSDVMSPGIAPGSLLVTQGNLIPYVLDIAANKVVVISFAVGDESTDITTGAAKVTLRMPYAMTLTEVRASVTTAPVGSRIIMDVNLGGTSIFTTNLLSIDGGEKTSTTASGAANITTTALTDDGEITVDIDQIGSSTAGTGIKIYLIGTRA
jgi:hypothetical protein